MHRKVVKTMLQSCFQKIFSHLFKLYQYVCIRNDVKTSESYTQVLGVLRMEGAGSARLWHRPPSRKKKWPSCWKLTACSLLSSCLKWIPQCSGPLLLQAGSWSWYNFWHWTTFSPQKVLPPFSSPRCSGTHHFWLTGMGTLGILSSCLPESSCFGVNQFQAWWANQFVEHLLEVGRTMSFLQPAAT